MPEKVTLQARSLPQLAAACAQLFSELRSGFEAAGDGNGCLRLRSERVDSVVLQLYGAWISSRPDGPEGLCLAAVGGYGRAELFPFSDLDLLFVARDASLLKTFREGIAGLARDLWDLQMRVAHSARTLDDCGRLDSENLEFSVSLLDLRYLAGDHHLFEALQTETLPHMIGRDGPDLIRNLVTKTSSRHANHGNTIFHLEPDVKESPGGLRDFHVARWLASIHEISAERRWTAGADWLPANAKQPVGQAVGFLTSVRCFLHLRQKRNDNLLTYELQERAATLGLGGRCGEAAGPAQWMREYYRHVRSIQNLTHRAIEDSRPSRSSLYGLFQDWRSRLSNADFSVIQGKIFPRSLVSGGCAALLGMFEMMARHSLELSREAERWVEDSLAALRAAEPSSGDSQGVNREAGLPHANLWPALRSTLALPATAEALRAMHRLGLLCSLIPEFRAIDALVIRDFYHRYTVDEHTFMTLQTLCELKRGPRETASGAQVSLGIWRTKLSELYAELEQPELLTLALLLHDVGKGMDAPDHVVGSLEAARSVCARLGLDSRDEAAVRFLIGAHLEMSSTVSRRDIFDPETLRAFAGKVGTPERLKMLCLLTCADINAVNPEALTPWKAEMLWQLYAMTANYFSRSVDEDRLQPEPRAVTGVFPLAEGADANQLKSFLDGFPRRYLATHSPSEVKEHFQLARKVSQNAVQVKVRRSETTSELTVLATDRPFLFASVTGTLAAWGMNILKAEAFANSSGVVLDVFRFRDLHRTLEMNPTEIRRLEETVADVLSGKASVMALMQGRLSSPSAPNVKIRTVTKVSFDDAASSRCTILELVAQDRPGLLYAVSAALAEFGCNIEVALIETEAQKAVDVFYLTRAGAKLGSEAQQEIRSALIDKLSQPWLDA